MGKTSHPEQLRQRVRHEYGKIARKNTTVCTPGCCTNLASASDQNLSLGCGNPHAIAQLKHGEIALDLGCGSGFDCFQASHLVGNTGRVIGVDMTPEMIQKARLHAESAGYSNVEFRLGEMENLPVADASVDVIISNCAVNLSPDKPRVFSEAWRVLKPGGRLAISDIVAIAEIPESMRKDETLYTSCITGAELISRLSSLLHAIGFRDIHIVQDEDSKAFICDWAPGLPVTDYVLAASITAIKPARPASTLRK